MSVQIFEQEKHKIYDKLSEFRSKIDDSLKRGQEFIDYRKNNMEVNERIRQDILGV